MNHMSRASREAMITALAGLVDPLKRSLIGSSEVVLHDLSKMPNSIVAISGHLTSRNIGGPATEALLRAWREGTMQTRIGYESTSPEGRALRSSTILIEDADGPFAALCTNTDVSVWQGVHDMTAAILHGGPWPGETSAPQIPHHQDPPRDIKQVATGLMREAIDQVGVPVSLMRKDHKLRVVDELRRRGFFLLKDSIEATANRLKVSRFTVYNYLNELEERGDADTDDSGKSA